MKKWLSLVFVGIFIISGFGTVATNVTETGTLSEQTITKRILLDSSSFEILDSIDDHILVRYSEQDSYLLNPGQPMLPRLIESYELPFAATNVQVEVQPIGVKHQSVSQEIRPAPAPVPYTLTKKTVLEAEKDEKIYSGDMLYPDAWFGFHVGCGLNTKGEHTTLVTVNLFPVRYRPATGELLVAEEFSLVLRYQPPVEDIFPAKSSYDLIIIGPEVFSTEIQRLVAH